MKVCAPTTTVLLDIDGTLLDSNDAHAPSWADALAHHGRPVPIARIRPLIGMGGDDLLRELLGLAADDPLAQTLKDDRRDRFLRDLLPALQPTPGARALRKLRDEGLARVVATSSSGPELRALLEQAGVADLVDDCATSDDAGHAKPAPDIVQAALRKAGCEPNEAVLLGDTPYDIRAARGAGVETLALRCGGGWSDADLAGAVAVYDSPADLLARWEHTPIFRRRIPAG